MKPYIAVLYDSFLESIRSRVLWMLLAAWTLLLAALFPLTISSTESYRISRRTFSSENSAKAIMDSLADASAGKGSKAARAVYAKLSEEFQTMLQQRKESDRKIAIGSLLEELNRLLTVEDLYDAEAWPTAERRKEIKELVEKESLTDSERERLNRRLIDLAFPNRLSSSDGQATLITWANIPLGQPLPLSIDGLRPIIERTIFPLVMRVGLGIAAMLIAIIITSPMIPDMFQTGSLHLLLSKPISRSLLFLTKFTGGCIFVAVNIVYLLIGLYLFAGIRLEIWNTGILWCIPLFIFMFMVYYSVSSLVGLIWKNPIICVVVTAVFWAVCFGVGTIHFFFDVAINIQPQATRIYAMNDTVVMGNAQGRLLIWDAKESTWRTAYGEVDGQQLLGPVWLPEQKNLYFARTNANPFGLGRSFDTKLEFARLPDVADSNDKTFRSKPWADGRIDSGPELPSNPTQIIPWKDSLAVVTREGLFAFDPAKVAGDEKQFPGLTSMFKTFGVNTDKAASAFQPLLKGVEFGKSFDLSVSPTFHTVCSISNGEVTVWKNGEKEMELQGSFPLEQDKGLVCLIACNDQIAIVCPNGEVPVLVDVVKRETVGKLEQLGRTSIKQIRVNSTGLFALLDQDGAVWIVSADGTSIEKPRLAGQDSALAISFLGENQLWVSHHVTQADRWDLKESRSTASVRPTLTVLEMVFRYLIDPFYLLNPKPAAVNQTIEYMLVKPNNKALALSTDDLNRPKEQSDPWQPIYSNTAFILVILGVSCWYLYRQDL